MMRRPRRLGLALGIVAGGIALGALLGAAADPKMKNLPVDRWTPPTASAEPAPTLHGVSVHEIVSYPDRYAPPLPDEAITDWAPDYPTWTYSDFASDWDEETVEVLSAEPAPALRPEPDPPAPLPPEPRRAGGLDAIY
jgi:hypothetical protein